MAPYLKRFPTTRKSHFSLNVLHSHRYYYETLHFNRAKNHTFVLHNGDMYIFMARNMKLAYKKLFNKHGIQLSEIMVVFAYAPPVPVIFIDGKLHWMWSKIANPHVTQ